MGWIVGLIVALVLFLFDRFVKKELVVNNENIPDDLVEWVPIAQKYARQYDVPSDIVKAVIMVESAGDQYARGSAGEWGLMQLKPIAVRDVRENLDETVDIDNYQTDPDENIKAGTAFLALQKKRAGSWDEGIKAYNQGFQGKDIFINRASTYLKKVNEFRGIF
jgi:soluble lytic murein transglycosylase-like protein